MVTVLIIDDNQEELAAYKAIFESAGCVVHAGETYEGVREKVGDITYDLVLCDYHSKGARPHTVLKLMRQRGVGPKEFYIHTGDPSAFAVDGMNGVVVKDQAHQLDALVNKVKTSSSLIGSVPRLCA